MLKVLCLNNIDDFASVDYTEMLSYHWEAPVPYRPRCFFRVCRVADKGIVCDLKAYESLPRTVCTDRDQQVYTDSCLEFFVAPVEGRQEYINIECNSDGVFLSQYGSQRDGRTLICNLTPLSPEVTAFSGSDSIGAYWGVRITVTYEFLDSLYCCDTSEYTCMRANFFKCGDSTETPHYIAFSPVGEMPPGFHNSDCFYRFN